MPYYRQSPVGVRESSHSFHIEQACYALGYDPVNWAVVTPSKSTGISVDDDFIHLYNHKNKEKLVIKTPSKMESESDKYLEEMKVMTCNAIDENPSDWIIAVRVGMNSSLFPQIPASTTEDKDAIFMRNVNTGEVYEIEQ